MGVLIVFQVSKCLVFSFQCGNNELNPNLVSFVLNATQLATSFKVVKVDLPSEETADLWSYQIGFQSLALNAIDQHQLTKQDRNFQFDRFSFSDDSVVDCMIKHLIDK
jgi:hypothetical protein